jgi:hypothetical protein
MALLKVSRCLLNGWTEASVGRPLASSGLHLCRHKKLRTTVHIYIYIYIYITRALRLNVVTNECRDSAFKCVFLVRFHTEQRVVGFLDQNPGLESSVCTAQSLTSRRLCWRRTLKESQAALRTKKYPGMWRREFW